MKRKGRKKRRFKMNKNKSGNNGHLLAKVGYHLFKVAEGRYQVRDDQGHVLVEDVKASKTLSRAVSSLRLVYREKSV